MLLSACGCAPRCNQPCGTWFGGATTIAPAPTYSLNIPSASQNPYYTPGVSPAVGGGVASPDPAAAPGLQWQQPNLNGNGASITPTPNNNGSRFVETQSTSPGRSVLVPGAPLDNRTAAIPATGSSFTDDRNFASTRIDERQDSTRVPVTDATAVRAPSQNLVAGFGVAQTFAQNGNQPRVFTGQGTVLSPNQPMVFSAQPVYGAQPQVFAGQAISPMPYGRPVIAQANPVNPQAGWQNRQPSSNQLR